MYPVGQMNVYHNLSVLSYNQQVSAKKKNLHPTIYTTQKLPRRIHYVSRISEIKNKTMHTGTETYLIPILRT